MRTQVCIIGGGPSGLLLSRLLHLSGIDSVVIERHPRDHVLSRIRAGVLEEGTVGVLERAGAARRLKAEGIPHSGIRIAARNRGFRVDFDALIGRRVMVYGQTEVTRDLYGALDDAGVAVFHGAQGAALHGLDGQPAVTFVQNGTDHRIDCDFVAGCDGFHGVSRASIPKARLKLHERVLPFAWLGVLSRTPPVSEELIYANHPRGFALCSMRNDALSRYYIQVPATDRIEQWPDTVFWDELRRRLPQDAAEALATGASAEKSIVPLRAFVAEPMRHGRLFLVGDAAHIVPPTGAKGLNLAVGDVHYLHEALAAYYAGDRLAPDRYSDRALARVWQAMRFSWWITALLHRFPGQDDFDQHLQEAEIDRLAGSVPAQTALATDYVGLPC